MTTLNINAADTNDDVILRSNDMQNRNDHNENRDL